MSASFLRTLAFCTMAAATIGFASVASATTLAGVSGAGLDTVSQTDTLVTPAAMRGGYRGGYHGYSRWRGGYNGYHGRYGNHGYYTGGVAVTAAITAMEGHIGGTRAIGVWGSTRPRTATMVAIMTVPAITALRRPATGATIGAANAPGTGVTATPIITAACATKSAHHGKPVVECQAAAQCSRLNCVKQTKG